MKKIHHLRVPVSTLEKENIKKNATKAGISVAAYLRNIGQNYPVKSVLDYEKTQNLIKINSDLGRLGGLFKFWLSNADNSSKTDLQEIRSTLKKIEETQKKNEKSY